METLSKNKQKRLRNRRQKDFRNKYPEVIEVNLAISAGVTLSTSVIAVNVHETNDDGSLSVRVLGKNYRLVLEHVKPKYVVVTNFENRTEFLDFDSALRTYKGWLGTSADPYIEGELTEEEHQIIAGLKK